MNKWNRSSGIMLLLVILGLGLRLYGLDSQPLRGDESFSIQFSAHSPSWLLPNIAHIEPNPPLYYFLLHYWMEWLGQSEFTTRYLSLAFGLLCIPLVYMLGRTLGEVYPGLLAAFLLTINPFQVWHSQDVRNYTLWPALSMASLIFLLCALRRDKTRYWVGYTAITLLSLYTHYYDMFLVLFHNLFFLVLLLIEMRRESVSRSRPLRLLMKWVAIQAILATIYVPWLAYGSSRLVSITEGESPTLWALFFRSLTTFSLGETVPTFIAVMSAPLLLALLVAGLGYAFKKERQVGLFLVLYILVPSLCVFAVAQVRPLFRERYLNAVAPAYYLAFAYSLTHIPRKLRRWRTVPLVAGVAFFILTGCYSLSNHYFHPHYQKSPDWRALAEYLESETGYGDVIVLNYPDPTFSYYYDGEAPSHVLPQGLLTPQMKTETAQALRSLAARYRRVWFYPLTDPGWDHEGFVHRWLNRHGRLVQERQAYGFRWLVYEPAVMGSREVEHPLDSRLGESIRLRGYEREDAKSDQSGKIALQAGEAVRLALLWEATDQVDSSYKVFIHLTDARGAIWAQQDTIPQGGDFPTDEWMSGDMILDHYSLLVPSDTPAGEYLLVVGMYDANSGQRLPVFDTSGEYRGDRAIVAQVIVEDES